MKWSLLTGPARVRNVLAFVASHLATLSWVGRPRVPARLIVYGGARTPCSGRAEGGRAGVRVSNVSTAPASHPYFNTGEGR